MQCTGWRSDGFRHDQRRHARFARQPARLTWNGKNPLGVEGGERTFLEDGDTVSITGWCQGENYCVGFGEVSGTILPAHPL
jgi:hypothetical protein